MASEKYIVITAENSFHISLRNILDPGGYVFMGSSGDPAGAIRLVRSYHPDFAIIDPAVNLGRMRLAIETIDDEKLCSCIIIAENRNAEIQSILDRTSVVSFSKKNTYPDVLLNTVEMAQISFRRIRELSCELSQAKAQRESRDLLEIAKAILMRNESLTENEAYNKIRMRSMNLRVPLKEIAESVISLENMKNRKQTRRSP